MVKKKNAGIYKVESIDVNTYERDPENQFVFNIGGKKVTPKQIEELAKNTESLYRLTKNNEIFSERTYKNERFVRDEDYYRKGLFSLTPKDPPLYQVIVDKPGYFVDEIVLNMQGAEPTIRFCRTDKNVSRYVSPVFTFVPNSEKPLKSVKFKADAGCNIFLNIVWLDSLTATLDEPLFENLSDIKSSELLKLAPSWKWLYGIQWNETVNKSRLCRNEKIEFIFIDEYSFGNGPSKHMTFNGKKHYSLGVDFIASQDGQYVLKHLDIKNKTTKPTDPDFENSPLELELSEVARFDSYAVLDTNTVALYNKGAKNFEDYAFYQGGKLIAGKDEVKEIFINNLTSIQASNLFGDALRMQKESFPFMTQEELLDCFLEVLNRNDNEDTSTFDYRNKYDGRKIYDYDINQMLTHFCGDEKMLLKMAKTPRFATRIICEKAKGRLNPKLEDLLFKDENSQVFCALKKHFVKVMQNSLLIQNLHDQRKVYISQLRGVQKQVAGVMQNPEYSEKMFKTGMEECDAKLRNFLNKMGVKCIANDSDRLVHTFDENYPILLVYDRWRPQNSTIYLLDEDGDRKDFIKFDVYTETTYDSIWGFRYNEKEFLRYRDIRHVDTLNAADKVTIEAKEAELPEYWRDFFGTPKDCCKFFYQVENADGSKGYFVENEVDRLADDGLKIPCKIETDLRATQGDLKEAYTDFKHEQFEIERREQEFFEAQAEYERQFEDHESENIALLNEDDGDGSGSGEGESELPF